eukprot:scaffold63582_cov77-Attheya_sp.AAC.1
MAVTPVERRCPSSDIEVTNFVDDYVSNVEEGMTLHASHNSKEDSCKDDANKQSGMQLHYEQAMAVAIAASKGIKQFYQGKELILVYGDSPTAKL